MISLDYPSRRPSYAELMEGEGAHIRLKLDTNEPIALTDFVGSFVGLGNQFDRFVAADYPDLKGETQVFVQDVRDGCIVADLVVMFGYAVLANTAPGLIDMINRGQILTKFVLDVQQRISPYLQGGRNPGASKAELSDYLKTVQAIARDPKASASLEAAVFEDGKRQVRAAFKFTANEARMAERQIEAQREEMDAKTAADHERVLLQFVRPSAETGKPGKPGGERGIIEKLHRKALPVLYASDLAEQRIRHEIVQAEHVFRRLFDVDVNVETNAAGKPVAYRITDFHTSFDPNDEAA